MVQVESRCHTGGDLLSCRWKPLVTRVDDQDFPIAKERYPYTQTALSLYPTIDFPVGNFRFTTVQSPTYS